MKKLYDVQCKSCDFIEEKFVNDFYEAQICTKCGEAAKCIYSPLAIQMKQVTSGRTKDGTPWQFVGAGLIDEESRDIQKFDVKKG